ncbi:MAG TPA: AMIN domain-containing protein [Epulopiscium sp.]|nr:AMIN domain-containing protein [Candidatus Epulonipiscium sp.]
MSKLIRNALLVTCILSLHIIKPATAIYAQEMTLTYDGKQHTYNKPLITLEINNKKIEMAMPPVQIDGRTLVPTREVFEPMGATVEWKAAEKKVFINHGDKLIVLEVDNSDAWVEGQSKKLDVPPKLINGKLMLPLRFIGETLGYAVDWNASTSYISINQIMSTPEVKPPTIQVPELITKVEEVRVQNQDDGISLYTIYLEKPLDSYSHFTQEGKIVVDIDSAKNLLDGKITLPDNPYVQIIRTSQFTPEKTRVVFDIIKETTSKVELSKDKTVITVSMLAGKIEDGKPEATKPKPEEITPQPEIELEEIEIKNFKYINSPQEAIVFKKEKGLSVSDIKINDDYRNRKITVTLPGNYSDVYNDGLMTIGSSTIDKILIQSNNKTEFIIHEKKIRAYEILDDGENIKIIFMQPKDKYQNIILLDMGHGAQDGGASANGLQEKKVNFEQGMQLYDLLEKDSNIKVYVTREDDSYPTNPARAQLANEIGADIFVSLHNNSFTNPEVNGTEVLYSTKDPKSKTMAQIVQNNMVSRLKMFDRGAKARPGLVVLNSTNMPAILVETGFLTNPGDAAKLQSPEFNRQVASVIYDSIVEIFNTLSFR